MPVAVEALGRVHGAGLPAGEGAAAPPATAAVGAAVAPAAGGDAAAAVDTLVPAFATSEAGTPADRGGDDSVVLEACPADESAGEDSVAEDSVVDEAAAPGAA